MKKTPKVSVVMPVYNSEKYLSESIESILNQSFSNFEFIIIDDGSSDSSWQIIEEYAEKDKRITPLKNEKNSGICISLNNGILKAKGEYILRIDSDDIAISDRIKKQVNFLDKNKEVVIVGGSIDICDEELIFLNKRLYNISDTQIREKLFRYSPFAHPAVCYRKQAIIDAGLYNPQLRDAEDYDLYFRLGNLGKFANLEDSVTKLRLRKNSISQSRGQRQERLTLFIRIKAVIEYGYSTSPFDKFYLLAQFISMYIIPYRVKFWLFNLFR